MKKLLAFLVIMVVLTGAGLAWVSMQAGPQAQPHTVTMPLPEQR